MTAADAAHNDLTKQAFALVQRRAFREAHALCLQVLYRDPADAEANFVLGLIGAEHDNFAKASELFERALQRAPKEPRYLAHWANTTVRKAPPIVVGQHRVRACECRVEFRRDRKEI